MSAVKFLQALINASEKAANIARACRQKHELFKLLVEEKSNEEKNQRFLQDFKTLADVLIQETVKHDLAKEFPAIADHIKGEESNLFTNTLGESIAVVVLEQQEDTSALLCKVLDGDKDAADLLAQEVHQEVHAETDLSSLTSLSELPIDALGIWIDPIDSTFEYIHGDDCEANEAGIYACGLRCVTVLIGAFLRSTGQPVLGVTNQPFYEQDSQTKIWQGCHYWGYSFGDIRASSVTPNAERSGVVLLSSSEGQQLRKQLEPKYKVVEAAGAGYKQLCVVLGLADIYILSLGSTYRWDSCAPHAILRALGGGIVSYNQYTSMSNIPSDADNVLGIKYNKQGSAGWRNNEGIVAYSNSACLEELFTILKSVK